MIRLSVLLRNIISEDPAYYVLQIKIDRSEVGYSIEITQGVVKKEFSTDCMFRSNVHCYIWIWFTKQFIRLWRLLFLFLDKALLWP